MSKCSSRKIDYLCMTMLDYPCAFDYGVKAKWEAFNEILNEDKVVHLAVSNFTLKQSLRGADVD